MMFRNKLVAVLKVDGKILREHKDIVYMNYKSEYTILLKNLDIRRAVKVDISIDGDDVLNNRSIVIRPNSETELEGFLSNDNVVHNRFKFIEKTQEVSNYRGDRIDDGIINISFSFEKVFSNASEIIHKQTPRYPNYNEPCWPYNPRDILYKCSTNTNQNLNASDDVLYSCNCNDNGITVKGSKTHQQFNTTFAYIWENEVYNMCFIIKGKTKSKQVDKPLFVCTKVHCETCGLVSKSNVNFCSRCGTSLI